MISVIWNGSELPQTGTNCWATEPGEPFSCHVLSVDGTEFTATIAFGSARWTQKSTHPQTAVDGASRKAGEWCRRFTDQFRALVAVAEKPKPRGAPRGIYTVAKVPDSPEQEEWIRKKRNPAR